MYKLPLRMQLIFDQLLPGQPVWDFCCDHGILGISAYRSGLFPEVYFVDQVAHIMDRLRARFSEKHFDELSTSRAEFFTSAGEDLDTVLKGTVVIAGVGTHTIFKILNSLHQKELLQAQRVILCPQNYEDKLVGFLSEIPHFQYEFCNEHYEFVERGRARKLLILHKKPVMESV
ncbi:tRNA (adenine(22)-N(1))-methyltransferase TrmK [Bdellovibrio bacteriovorus]|nr:tRNA (adenine(22)-N(1))-methyltransferase TrmK [Bdellovibrio bacteriovorus]